MRRQPGLLLVERHQLLPDWLKTVCNIAPSRVDQLIQPGNGYVPYEPGVVSLFPLCILLQGCHVNGFW